MVSISFQLFAYFITISWMFQAANSYDSRDSSEEKSAKEGLKQVMSALLKYTRDYSVGEPFTIRITKSYIEIDEYNWYNFWELVLITPFVHMSELCPEEFRECWCGFIREPKYFRYDSTNRMRTALKICSSNPVWMENKEYFLEGEFDLFNVIILNNGTILENAGEVERSMIEQEALNLRSYFEESLQPNNPSWDIQLNKHNRDICPVNLGWCYCGYSGDVLSYMRSNKTEAIVEEPRVIVDCRTHSRLPFETRNCSIVPKESLSWYKRLSKFLDFYFPCGHV